MKTINDISLRMRTRSALVKAFGKYSIGHNYQGRITGCFSGGYEVKHDYRDGLVVVEWHERTHSIKRYGRGEYMALVNEHLGKALDALKTAGFVCEFVNERYSNHIKVTATN